MHAGAWNHVCGSILTQRYIIISMSQLISSKLLWRPCHTDKLLPLKISKSPWYWVLNIFLKCRRNYPENTHAIYLQIYFTKKKYFSRWYIYGFADKLVLILHAYILVRSTQWNIRISETYYYFWMLCQLAYIQWFEVFELFFSFTPLYLNNCKRVANNECMLTYFAFYFHSIVNRFYMRFYASCPLSHCCRLTSFKRNY